MLALAVGFSIFEFVREGPSQNPVAPRPEAQVAPASEPPVELAQLSESDPGPPSAANTLAGESAREPVEAPPPGAFTIELVDRDLAPIAGARARLYGEARVRTSDAEGLLSFDRPGARGLIVAQGFQPVSFEVPRGRAALELREDRGLDLHVRWEDTGDPVEGARITRVGLFDQAKLAALAQLVGEPRRTNAQGYSRVDSIEIDNDCARLLIEHPQGVTLWQVTGALFHDAEVTPRLDVAMPRSGGGLQLRFVDDEGVALVDRRVWISNFSRVGSRTDEQGRARIDLAVRFPDHHSADHGGVVVEIVPDRAWWWAGFLPLEGVEGEILLRVSPVRIHGRVVTDVPREWQVASANLIGEEGAPQPVCWPRADELVWHDLREDGGFAFDEGWQGVSTAVFLRPRGSSTVIEAALVPPSGGPVTLEAKPTCRVTIEVVDAAEADLAGAVLDLFQTEGPTRATNLAPAHVLRLDPLLPLQSTVVPRGTYEAKLRTGTAFTILSNLDATGPEIRMPIRLPKLRRLAGTVRGTLSGPLGHTRLNFASVSQSQSASVQCDSRGRFAVDLPEDVEITASAWWRRDGDPYSAVSERTETWIVAPGQTECDFVRREAELRVVERPWNPLLAGMAPRVHTRNPDGSTGKQVAGFDLRTTDGATVLLPPGDYQVMRNLGELRALSLPVALADGERRELLLDSQGVAALALEVHIEHDGARQIRVELRHADGRPLWRCSYSVPDKGPFQLFQAFEAGTYSAYVGTYASPQEHELPLASWSGLVEAVSGATEATLVHLR